MHGIPALALLLVLIAAYLPSHAKVQADEGVVVATVRVNFLEVDLSGPEFVTVGERFRLVATLKNGGSAKIINARATIQLPLTGLALKGQAEEHVGAIRAGEDRSAKWKLVAEAAGSYVVLLTAVGTEEPGGDLLEAQDTAIIEVIEGPPLDVEQEDEALAPPDDEHEEEDLPFPDDEHEEEALPPPDDEHEEEALPPPDVEHEEETLPPSEHEHEEEALPAPDLGHEEETLQPSGNDVEEGGAIGRALSVLWSLRGFVVSLVAGCLSLAVPRGRKSTYDSS